MMSGMIWQCIEWNNIQMYTFTVCQPYSWVLAFLPKNFGALENILCGEVTEIKTSLSSYEITSGQKFMIKCEFKLAFSSFVVGETENYKDNLIIREQIVFTCYDVQYSHNKPQVICGLLWRWFLPLLLSHNSFIPSSSAKCLWFWKQTKSVTKYVILSHTHLQCSLTP